MSKTWLFFTLSLLLSVTAAGFSDVVGHGAVKAIAGEDVVLPCHLDPPFDLSRLVVDWTWDDHTVHLYRHRNDDYDFQLQQFRGRTSMFHSKMKDGNISLKLSNVRLEDSGLYVCYVPRLENQVRRGNIDLTVYPRDQDGGRGGNYETEDDKKQSRDQTGATAGGAVGAVIVIILLVLLVLGWIYKDRLKTWRNGRRRRERRKQENHQQGERGNSVEINPLNPDPDQVPLGPVP